MSVKKYSNLTIAEVQKQISIRIVENRDYYEDIKRAKVNFDKEVKDYSSIIYANNKEIALLRARLKSPPNLRGVPKTILGYTIRKIGREFVIGCGAVRVNKTQLKSFLKIETSLSKRFSKETIQQAHRQAQVWSNSIRGNYASDITAIHGYRISTQEVRGKRKYIFGCGAVKLNFEEIVLFSSIYSRIDISGVNFRRNRNIIISTATKMLNSLN